MRWRAFRGCWFDDEENGRFRPSSRRMRSGYMDRVMFHYLHRITVIDLNGQPIPPRFWWAR